MPDPYVPIHSTTAIEDKLEETLFKDLLYLNYKDLNLDINLVRDNFTTTKENFYFLKETSNIINLDLETRSNLLVNSLFNKNSNLYSIFIKKDKTATKDYIYNKENIRKHLNNRLEFIKLLGVATYLLAACPIRGTEIENLKYINSTSLGERNLFIDNSTKLIRVETTYSKTSNITNKDSNIVRFFSSKLSNIIKVYLVYYIPLYKYLYFIENNKINTSSYLLEDREKAISSITISKTLGLLSEIYLKARITISSYRQLIKYIINSRLNIDIEISIEEEEEEDNIKDLLFNHSSKIANLNYGRDYSIFRNKNASLEQKSRDFTTKVFSYFNLVDRDLKPNKIFYKANNNNNNTIESTISNKRNRSLTINNSPISRKKSKIELTKSSNSSSSSTKSLETKDNNNKSKKDSSSSSSSSTNSSKVNSNLETSKATKKIRNKRVIESSSSSSSSNTNNKNNKAISISSKSSSSSNYNTNILYNKESSKDSSSSSSSSSNRSSLTKSNLLKLDKANKRLSKSKSNSIDSNSNNSLSSSSNYIDIDSISIESSIITKRNIDSLDLTKSSSISRSRKDKAKRTKLDKSNLKRLERKTSPKVIIAKKASKNKAIKDRSNYRFSKSSSSNTSSISSTNNNYSNNFITYKIRNRNSRVRVKRYSKEKTLNNKDLDLDSTSKIIESNSKLNSSSKASSKSSNSLNSNLELKNLSLKEKAIITISSNASSSSYISSSSNSNSIKSKKLLNKGKEPIARDLDLEEDSNSNKSNSTSNYSLDVRPINRDLIESLKSKYIANIDIELDFNTRLTEIEQNILTKELSLNSSFSNTNTKGKSSKAYNRNISSSSSIRYLENSSLSTNLVDTTLNLNLIDKAKSINNSITSSSTIKRHKREASKILENPNKSYKAIDNSIISSSNLVAIEDSIDSSNKLNKDNINRVLSYSNRKEIVEKRIKLKKIGREYLNTRKKTLEEYLKELFLVKKEAISSFKSIKQREAILSIIELNPFITYITRTGGGKSLLFFLPSFIYSKRRFIVIVPRISLIEDLYNRSKEFKLNSTIFNKDSIDLDSNLIFISIENSYLEEFKDYIYKLKSLNLAITIYLEEAHLLLLEDNFRNILARLTSILRLEIQLVFITATLPLVLEDILEEKFLLNSNIVIRESTTREDIEYIVLDTNSPISITKEILLKEKETREEKDKYIIFTNTKKEALEVSKELNIPYYFSELEEENKIENSIKLKEFLDSSSKTNLIVATIALIVGIDYPSIKIVIFFPSITSLVNTIQGIGRIRNKGKAIIFYNSKTKLPIIDSSLLDYTKENISIEDFKELDSYKAKEFYLNRICLRITIEEFLDNNRIEKCSSTIIPCYLCSKRAKQLENTSSKANTIEIEKSILRDKLEKNLDFLKFKFCINYFVRDKLPNIFTHNISNCPNLKDFREKYISSIARFIRNKDSNLFKTSLIPSNIVDFKYFLPRFIYPSSTQNYEYKDIIIQFIYLLQELVENKNNKFNLDLFPSIKELATRYYSGPNPYSYNKKDKIIVLLLSKTIRYNNSIEILEVHNILKDFNFNTLETIIEEIREKELKNILFASSSIEHSSSSTKKPSIKDFFS